MALAIDGLRVVRETEAVDSLGRLARDQIKPSEIRLKSALALGWIQREGLESTATDLMSASPAASGASGGSATTSLLNRLVSARLLRYHSGDEAVEQPVKDGLNALVNSLDSAESPEYENEDRESIRGARGREAFIAA